MEHNVPYMARKGLIMDLNNWLVFAQIVDCGGLSAASKRLGIPKSTLSRRLSKLEDELGFRLLNRKGRGFVVTDTGKLFYQESVRLGERVNRARERLIEVNQPQAGTVRMTAPKAPGGYFLGRWLAEFMNCYPMIHIELDLTDKKISLFEGNYDLALRVGPLADSSLIARKLGTSKRTLVASPEYLKSKGLPKCPEDLVKFQCIGFSKQSSGQCVWPLTKKGQTRSFSFNPNLRNDDMATTLCLTEAGAGIAMIPIFVCRESIELKKLVPVLTDWSGPEASFYLLSQERELMPSRVRLLKEFLINKAKDVI